nr:hypothetical protein [Tanacetum cinerariifolium]
MVAASKVLMLKLVVEGVTTVMPITTAKEKAQRRLEVKAKIVGSFRKEIWWECSYKENSKESLKAAYKNFTALSSEMLDQTFDRLQKLMSQLELLEEKLSQEDVNQKLLRRKFMPPIPDLSFTGLDEFVNNHVVENCKAKSSEEEPKVVRKHDDALIIKEWVLDNEEDDVS